MKKPTRQMDVTTGLLEIWKQHTEDGPTNRATTSGTRPNGESRMAFESALEARHDLGQKEDEEKELLETFLEHIKPLVFPVENIVFPFHAMEMQRQWMAQYLRTPSDLPRKRMATALRRSNNYLPALVPMRNNRFENFRNRRLLISLNFPSPELEEGDK